VVGLTWSDFAYFGGFCLKKKVVACTCILIMKEDTWKTDLWQPYIAFGDGWAIEGVVVAAVTCDKHVTHLRAGQGHARTL
jgi:hypothetical protein